MLLSNATYIYTLLIGSQISSTVLIPGVDVGVVDVIDGGVVDVDVVDGGVVDVVDGGVVDVVVPA